MRAAVQCRTGSRGSAAFEYLCWIFSGVVCRQRFPRLPGLRILVHKKPPLPLPPIHTTTPLHLQRRTFQNRHPRSLRLSRRGRNLPLRRHGPDIHPRLPRGGGGGGGGADALLFPRAGVHGALILHHQWLLAYFAPGHVRCSRGAAVVVGGWR